MWRKKKSAKVLIVSDDSEISKIVADNKSLPICNQTSVESCEKAFQVATSGSPCFDFLITDLAKLQMDGVKFAKKFIRLSPSTKVIYMIP